MEYGLALSHSQSHELVVYSDADWAAAQTPIAPLLDTMCFLEITLYHGPPSANTPSRGLVLKLNTGVLPMLWLRHAGFVSS